MMTRTLLTDAELTAALADHGLTGWRATGRDHPTQAGQKVVILTWPGFHPKNGDRPIAGVGPDQPTALAEALTQATARKGQAQ